MTFVQMYTYGAFLASFWCSLNLVLNFLPFSPMYFNSQLWHGISYTIPQVFNFSTLSWWWTKASLDALCDRTDTDMSFAFFITLAILSDQPFRYGITTQPLDLSSPRTNLVRCGPTMPQEVKLFLGICLANIWNNGSIKENKNRKYYFDFSKPTFFYFYFTWVIKRYLCFVILIWLCYWTRMKTSIFSTKIYIVIITYVCGL